MTNLAATPALTKPTWPAETDQMMYYSVWHQRETMFTRNCLFQWAAGGSELADVLYDGSSMEVLTGPRIRTGNTHGTGCTTASAIAAFLARGLPPPAAVRAARSYITEALRSSAHLQIGSGSQRPFNHL